MFFLNNQAPYTKLILNLYLLVVAIKCTFSLCIIFLFILRVSCYSYIVQPISSVYYSFLPLSRFSDCQRVEHMTFKGGEGEGEGGRKHTCKTKNMHTTTAEKKIHARLASRKEKKLPCIHRCPEKKNSSSSRKG